MLARFGEKPQVFVGDGQLEMTRVTFGRQGQHLLEAPARLGIVPLLEPVLADGLGGGSILRVQLERGGPFAQGVLGLL